LGYTKVKVKLANPNQPGRYQEVDLLVDTGAIYTVLNGKKLRELGIESVDKMESYSINNQRLTRDVGVSLIEVMGRRWLTSVIFGEEGDNEALGVTTLEQLGLQIDPVSRQIKPLPLYLLQVWPNENQERGRERQGREQVIVPSEV
jgi:clan AA aspartic protease